MAVNISALKKSSVGLYIDTQTVCVAALQLVNGSPKIAGHAEVPGTNLFEAGAQNNQKLLEKLKKAFDLSGAKARSVNLVVPPEASMIRHFELPPMPKKEEKNAVRFEAQKYVPFDMKDLYFDHESHLDAAKKRMGVVFFACRRQWVDQIAALLLLLGIRLDRVELASQSVMRGFRQHSTKTSGQTEALVLPSDDTNAELVFFKERSVLLTRHLSLAQPAAPTDNAFLVSELRLSMDYFYENYKGEKIGRLHWAGDAGESGRQLGESLSKELSLQVETSDFLRALSNGQPGTAALATAYGAALAGLLPEKKKQINLRPSEAVSAAPPANWPEEKKQLQDLAAKESIVLGLILILFYGLSLASISSKNSDLRKAMQAYPKAAGADISEPLVQLQDKRRIMMEKISFGSNLVDERPYFTNKLDRLAQLVPANIRLATLEFTDGIDNLTGRSMMRLHLEGYVRTDTGGELTVVNKFIDLLSQDREFMRGFDEIRITSTKKTIVNEVPVTRFELECVTVRTA